MKRPHPNFLQAVILALALLTLASAGAAEPEDIPIEDLGTKYQLQGKLHLALGQLVKIGGIAINGDDVGFDTGRKLRVQQINGHAIQEDIRINFQPYFGKWGEYALPKIKSGQTLELYGYETGGYDGHPYFPDNDPLPFPPLQTPLLEFRTNFIVLRAKPLPPIHQSPADFEGQIALMEGTARTVANEAFVQGNGWSVSVDREKGWPSDIEGKEVETEGLYAPDEKGKTYKLLNGTWRLIRLEDQIGRAVDLHARAYAVHDRWSICYRGVDLYVENLSKLPGWSAVNGSRPVEIRGILEKAKLPSLDLNSSIAGPVDCYIVRKASWAPLPALRFSELPLYEQEIDPKVQDFSETVQDAPKPATPAPKRSKPKKRQNPTHYCQFNTKPRLRAEVAFPGGPVLFARSKHARRRSRFKIPGDSVPQRQ